MMLKQLLKSSEQFLSRFGFMLSLLFLNQINSSWIAFVHPLFFLMEWMTLYLELSVKYMRCMFPVLCLTVAIFPDFENQNIGGDCIEIS